MSTTAIRRTPFSSPMTWSADTLLAGDGVLEFDTAHLQELHTASKRPRFRDMPIVRLHADQFDLPSCQKLMAQARHQLQVENGFVILDRLPVASLAHDTSIRMYWLLMSMLGQLVAQKWDGTRVYDVTDTNASTKAGNGVRSSRTREGQAYHCDNSFNLAPDFVGLLCLRTAKEGGISGLISFESLYNRLLEQRPDVLERLYQPFYFDRQLEHAPHEARTNYKPMIVRDGDSIAFNFNPRLVEQGYAVKGLPMDDAAVEALKVLRELSEAPGLGKTFSFSPGQIQIVNNRRMGHRRTAYVDHDDPGKKRHLVRLWLREHGSSEYAG